MPKPSTKVLGVRMPEDVIADADKAVKGGRYDNRNDFIVCAMRREFRLWDANRRRHKRNKGSKGAA